MQNFTITVVFQMNMTVGSPECGFGPDAVYAGVDDGLTMLLQQDRINFNILQTFIK
jgi:hypothetical protein